MYVASSLPPTKFFVINLNSLSKYFYHHLHGQYIEICLWNHVREMKGILNYMGTVLYGNIVCCKKHHKTIIKHYKTIIIIKIKGQKLSFVKKLQIKEFREKKVNSKNQNKWNKSENSLLFHY